MKNFNFWKILIFEKFKFRIEKFQFLKNFYSDWKIFLFRILKNFYLWKISIQNWKITIQNWKFFLFRIEKISIFEKFLFRIKKFPYFLFRILKNFYSWKISIQNWKITIQNWNKRAEILTKCRHLEPHTLDKFGWVANLICFGDIIEPFLKIFQVLKRFLWKIFELTFCKS